MNLILILWLSVWGGMYTGTYNITAEMWSDTFAFFQSVRAFLPLLAVYVCILWIFLLRMKIPAFSNPLGLLLYYGILGIFVSILSPKFLVALFWGGLFISPILVLWIVMNKENHLDHIGTLIYVNYFIVTLIVLSLLPQVIRISTGKAEMGALFNLPFKLGGLTKNGAGRYALVLIVIGFVRFLNNEKKSRYVFLALLFPAIYLIALTQSRTALLGLGVVSVIFVFIKGLKWHFFLIGPVSAYVIYLSGYKWRAQEQLAKLISLSGRELTWKEAIEMVRESPLLGWGFHSDRILLDFHHMHNSYLHALIHSGIIGMIIFVAAWISIWKIILNTHILKKLRECEGAEHVLLMESVLIIGFLSVRSLFESTAAFYGVDLLLFVPAVAYIYYWSLQYVQTEPLISLATPKYFPEQRR